MGGSVGLTIREPDGTEHRMTRWTNILPWVLTDLGLLEDDPKHVQEVLAQWRVMRADYEAHVAEYDPKGRYPFEHPMTEVYAPYPFLAPREYGLVVVDMQSKVILSSQGYTIPGEIHSFAFSGENTESPDSNFQRFKRLFDAGRIRTIRYHHDPDRRQEPVPWRSAEEALAAFQALDRDSDLRGFAYQVDMHPYVVEHILNLDAEKSQAMRERILQLGFTLSAEEEAVWTKWSDPASWSE